MYLNRPQSFSILFFDHVERHICRTVGCYYSSFYLTVVPVRVLRMRAVVDMLPVFNTFACVLLLAILVEAVPLTLDKRGASHLSQADRPD